MQGYARYRGYSDGFLDNKRRLALVLIALLAVVLVFDLSASGALARIAGPDSAPVGWAGQEFILREGPRVNAPRIRAVKPGEKFRLVDSVGGEVLDSRSATPSKWYLVRPEDGGEAGWAYSGWIRR